MYIVNNHVVGVIQTTEEDAKAVARILRDRYNHPTLKLRRTDWPATVKRSEVSHRKARVAKVPSGDLSK